MDTDTLHAGVILQVLINLQAVAKRRTEAEAARRRALEAEQERLKRRRRAVKKFWVTPWSKHERRLQFGHWDNLIQELRVGDVDTFFNFLRMTAALFDELLRRIERRIQKKNTHWRRPLAAGMKLAVTLRHLATGDKYMSLGTAFRCNKKSIAQFIPEVCDALRDELADEVMIFPKTSAEWKEISAHFERRWNVPHAIGALDGKHIRIKKPINSGSLYYNYKGYFSVVLLALVDADYKFMFADVGGVGHQSDCQLFNDSELKEALDQDLLNLPAPEPMTNDTEDTPYFFLGDDAFALTKNMVKPYSQHELSRPCRIFNYRISRGRMVVENAFGILAQRWQFLLGSSQQSPDVVTKMVNAAVCLHNLMRMRKPQRHVNMDREDENHNVIPGAWRLEANLTALDARRQGHRELEEGKAQRAMLTGYFNCPAGSVPWQEDMVPMGASTKKRHPTRK